MKVCHLLHIVGYLHHYNCDQVCKVCRSRLVKIGLWETSHLAVSDSSTISTYLVICDDKKPNLFLKELILSWAIIGRFLFFTLKFSRKPAVRDVLLLLLTEADSGLKRCWGSTRLLFEISEHSLAFQNFSIAFRKFLRKRFERDWFKSSIPLPPRYVTFTLFLFIFSIFSCKNVF